jgi:alkylation response protein AidB-like acyl-CoA dehydrogenase
VSATHTAPQPLTQLSEEEQFFYSTVKKIAEEEIGPHVNKMDEEQHYAPGLVDKLFEMGLMGIEIPEALGGAGGSFFDAILAVEAISTVEPGVGVLVDVQNTLCVNALLRWGSQDQKKKWLPKIAANTVCSYSLSEAGSGSDAFALETRY